MGPKCFIDPVVTPKIEFAEGKLSTTRTRRSGFSKEMLQDFTGFGTDDWKIDLSLYAALKHPISRIGIQNNLILRRMVFAKTGAEPREKPRILSRFIQVLNHTQPQHVWKKSSNRLQFGAFMFYSLACISRCCSEFSPASTAICGRSRKRPTRHLRT